MAGNSETLSPERIAEMERRNRVNKDRGEMARRALVKAGYLTGEESKGLTPEFLMEIAAGFVADILHLARSEGGKFHESLVEGVGKAAIDNYQSDGGKWT